MKQNNKQKTGNTGWRRVIALLLAAAMLVIPVHFPGHAHAVEEETVYHPTYFTDDFSNEKYLNGVSYQWNMSSDTWTVADGILTENTEGTGSYNRWMTVSATTADPENPAEVIDIAYDWQDYTVETKFTKQIYTYTSGEEEKQGVHTVKIMANVQEDNRFYYVLEITGGPTNDTGTLALRKAWLDETYLVNGVATSRVVETLLASKGSNAMKPGTQHTMALKVENITLEGGVAAVQLTAIYDGKTAFTAIDSADFEHSVTGQTGENSVKLDAETKKCSTLYTAGTAGLRVAPQYGITQFDDFKIAKADGTILFADDFSDDRFVNGMEYQWFQKADAYKDVTYNWTESFGGSLESAKVVEENDNSYYKMTTTTTTSGDNTLFLNGVAGSLDIDQSWTDYTVEMDMRMNLDLTNDKYNSCVAYLLTRVQDPVGTQTKPSYYRVHFRTGQSMLFKYSYNTTDEDITTSVEMNTGDGTKDTTLSPGGYLGTTGGDAVLFSEGNAKITANSWYKVKMVMKGNTISFYLYDMDGNFLIKQKAANATYNPDSYIYDGEGYVFTDDQENSTSAAAKLPALSHGGIGIGVTGRTDIAFSADFDNIKITLSDGTEAYSEDFEITDDEGAAGDYLTTIKSNAAGDMNFDWSVTKNHTYSTYGVGKDGRFRYFTAPSTGGVAKFFLNVTDTNDVDLDADWDNYTISTDVQRESVSNGTNTSGYSCGLNLIGRVQDENSYYALKYRGSSLYLLKYFLDTETNKQAYYSLESFGINLLGENEEKVHVFMTFANNDITYGIKVGETETSRTYTDTGSYVVSGATKTLPLYTKGGAGFHVDGSSGDKDGWTAYYDDVTIKDEDGNVLFTEDFAIENNTEINEEFVTYSRLFRKAYRANVSNDWTVSNTGTYASGGTNASVSCVTVNNGTADLAKSWTDYIVQADVILDSSNSAAAGALVARYSDAGYYEMVVEADGSVVLKLFNGSKKTVLAEYTPAALTSTLSEGPVTVKAQLEVSGTKLIGSLGGEEVITYDTAADTLKLTAGAPGLTSGTAVSYDNFSVTTHDFADEWSQDQAGTYHYHACAATGCTAVADKADHTVGTAATCKVGNICQGCGLTYGDVDPANHAADGEKTWSTQNETQHAQTWNCCGAVVVALENHEWDKGKCTECEYECVNHTGGEAHCQIGKICETCGKEYADKDLNNHPISSVWVKTETTHKKVFSGCCGAVDVAEEEHEWENGICTECEYECQHTGGTATCIAKAECTECGEAYGAVDAANHAQAPVWVRTNTTHKLWFDNCCDAIEVEEGNHDWQNGMCTVCTVICEHSGGTATCVEKAICQYCGLKHGELAPNNHTAEAEWVKTATTHKKWYDDCCDAIVVAEEGHHWENGVCTECEYECQHTGGTATCLKGKICETCGKEYTAVNSSNHTKDAKWVQTAQKHTKKYECCGADVVAEEDHEWENGVCKECEYECQHTGGTATCIAKAECTECGETYGAVDAANHAQAPVWVRTNTTHKLWFDNCCDAIVVEEEGHHWENGVCSECEYECQHTGGTATCIVKAECTECGEAYGALASNNHTAEAEWVKTATTHKKWYDDCCDAIVVAEEGHHWENGVCTECEYECQHTGGTADCQKKAKCSICGEAYGELNADKHTKEAKWTTTADKHSKAYECCGKVVVAEEAHKGGTATCEQKAKCEVCNAEYGALAAHKGGEATCTDKAKCDVCGEAYGELDADNHTKEAKWTTTADKHSKAYECCGKVVVAEEAHEWKDGKCEECGYEAEVGTEQKPIEIPADKETVKEEAKVEAGEEKHYELDEDMAGKVITIKGEDAFVIVDGKKYEAKNGMVEVKLPTKTGKISVVIGNAGTKAGAFSITIATPDDTNSDTGDNSAIVLFGSLMALSVLAAGVLLIPGIRKKLTAK